MSRYLSLEEILEINAEMTKKFGGVHGLPDHGALPATSVFLLLNGHHLVFDDSEAYQWLIGLFETGRLTKVNLESWLRQHIQRI